MTNKSNDSILVDLVEVCIRPVKVLWFIPPSQDLSTFKKTNTIISRLWGGVGHCIIPQIEYQPSAPWYSIIKSYDPDIIVYDDSVSEKTILPHNTTALSLTYSKIDKDSKEDFTSTFGLGMNLHKFDKYKNFNYGLVHKKDYYWHIVLGDPPSRYVDYDINGNRHDYRYVHYTKDVSVLFHRVPPSIESQTIGSYENSIKSHKSERSDENRRDMFYNLCNATTIGLSMNLDKLPSKFMNSYFGGTIVVIGDYSNIETIALYWNLRISFRNIYLLTKEKIFTNFDFKFQTEKKTHLALTSIELDFNQLDEIKEDLTNKFNTIQVEILTQDDLCFIPFPEYRWKQLGITTEPITIVSNKIKTSIRNVNEFLKELYDTTGKLNFVTELRFKSKKFPKRMILHKLLGDSGSSRVTSSHDLAINLSDEDVTPTLGSAYLTKSFTFNLSFPAPITILESLCQNSLGKNFQKIELSNLGRYTNRFIHLAGSLNETIKLIDNKWCFVIISAFIRTRKDENDTLIKDDFSYDGLLNQVKRIQQMQNLDEKLYQDGLLELIQKEYVIQGLALKCTSCSSKDWYHLENITNSYKCIRCGSINFIGLKPNWSYRLNQLVFKVLPESSNLTLETIIALKSESHMSFEFIPEFEIYYTDKSKKINNYEIDFFAIQDGRIIIGETKHSKFGFGVVDRQKYEEVLKLLQPDIFILSFKKPDKPKKINKNIELLEAFCVKEDVEFKQLELTPKFDF